MKGKELCLKAFFSDWCQFQGRQVKISAHQFNQSTRVIFSFPSF